MIASWSDRRRLNALGAAIAFGLVGYALFAEHVQGYLPCPLCILQRVAMIGLGLVFVAAAIHAPAGGAARVYGALGALIAATGAAVSGRHLFLQYAPKPDLPSSCGPSSLTYFFQNFQFNDALSKVFYPRGDCGTVDWTLLGLSMPGWVLMSFVALGALAWVANWKPSA